MGRSLGNSAALRVTPNMIKAFAEETFSNQRQTYKTFVRKKRKTDLLQEIVYDSIWNVTTVKLVKASLGKSAFEYSEKINKRRSLADSIIGLVCYAKNSEGYSVQPCLFSLQLVGTFNYKDIEIIFKTRNFYKLK